MPNTTLTQVEAKLNELIRRYAELKREHQILQQKEGQWFAERNCLLEKNEMAKARIDNMLQRLKQIETEVQS